jgi:translation initiation factor IF-3
LSDEILINDRIRARTVRLITDDGQTRVTPFPDAMFQARKLGLDLMLVAAGDPPVCRILDASRFRYEKKKTEREQAKRQREMAIDTKEIQLRPVTDQNDLLIKARRAKSFLGDGDKVKIIVRFRGRERHHRDYGRRVIERFLSEVGDHKIDKPMADGDSDLTIILASVISKSDIIKQRERSDA